MIRICRGDVVSSPFTVFLDAIATHPCPLRYLLYSMIRPVKRNYNKKVLKEVLYQTGYEFLGFCRKFSFEAIGGMVSPLTHAAKDERDDGDQLQRGLCPARHYSDGRPLVCRLSFEHAP